MTEQKRYRVGDRIENPESGDASIFAGYDDDDQEQWCDIGEFAEDKREFLDAPERKTFMGFNGAFTRWSQSAKDFAEAVDHELKCH